MQCDSITKNYTFSSSAALCISWVMHVLVKFVQTFITHQNWRALCAIYLVLQSAYVYFASRTLTASMNIRGRNFFYWLAHVVGIPTEVCMCLWLCQSETHTNRNNGKSKIFFYANQFLPDFSEEPNQTFVSLFTILSHSCTLWQKSSKIHFPDYIAWREK